MVTPENGAPFTVELNPVPDEPSVYESEFTAAANGTYRAEVNATESLRPLLVGSPVQPVFRTTRGKPEKRP